VVFVIFILSAFRNAGAAAFLVLALVIGAVFFWIALGISKSGGRKSGDMPMAEKLREAQRRRRR
jgi:threonine/homoserine/homoserine lactone efflux protein